MEVKISPRIFGFIKLASIHLLAIALISYSTPTLAQSTCSSTGPQNVAVLAVNLPNATLPPTTSFSDLQDIFFGTNIPGINVAQLLDQASYGQVSVTGNVLGPYNLTGTYTCNDMFGSMLSDAITAAVNAGVNFSNYNRLVMIFPNPHNSTSTCAGEAAVGSCTYTTVGGTTYNVSPVAINASYIVDYSQYSVTARQEGVSLGAHELGHSFGILHSGTLTPATAMDVVGPLSSPGTLNDGGDNQVSNDQGAIGYLGQFPASEMAAVHWLQQSASGYQLVQQPGTYTIGPIDGPNSGLKALKVQRGTNNAGYYLWLEYRLQPAPYDSTSFYGSGVFGHYQDPTTDYRQGYLLNFNPQLNNLGGVWMNPDMQVGQTWTDNYSDVSISLVNLTSTSATISVAYANGGGNTSSGGSGGTSSTGSLAAAVSVPTNTYSKNQTVSITGTVTYATAPEAGANVTFTVTAPNGKAAKQNGVTGSNGQAGWAYGLSKHAASGTYSVIVQATSNGAIATSLPTTFNVQ